MKISDLVAAAVVSGVFSIVVAYIQTSPLKKELPGPLEHGQKICTVVVLDHFSTSTIVPKTWSAAVCQSMITQVGNPRLGDIRFRLGCAFADGVNLGTTDGAPPVPPNKNCGW